MSSAPAVTGEAPAQVARVVRVLLADEHVPVRRRIRAALERDGCLVVAETATGGEAVRLAEELRPDVVVLDVRIPGNGVTATREIAARLPGTPVVVLTHSRDEEDLFDSLRAGAAGYLLKDADPGQLAGALRGVLAGEGAMSPVLVARIMDEFRGPTRRRFSRGSPAAARLSPREWEVMHLLAAGRSTSEVARELFLSPTTVRVHVSTVLRKLRVEDRQSALRLLRGE